MPNRGEFRASTDHLLALLDELRSTEERKRSESLGSPTFVALAEEAVAQSRLAFRWCEMQLQMAQESAARVARGEQAPDIRLIEVVPRPIDRILANWREAQLRLEVSAPGSPEATAAADDIEHYREEYQVAHAALAETAAELSMPPNHARPDPGR